MPPHSARNDRLDHEDARARREDPLICERIERALGPARTVVNVGAGSGAYEPRSRHVVAIEISDDMARARPRSLAPAIRASAGRLPLRDGAVDAAMTILGLHQWDAEQARGARELRRVAAGPVVILTFDPRVSAELWLMKHYFPEVADLDFRTFPIPERIVEWLGGRASISPVAVARDTPDFQLGSCWAQPERVLDPHIRAGMAGFVRAEPAAVQRGVAALRRDLDDGTWDARHGQLRQLPEYDVGLRLIVAE
jgi:hypothetical protein